MLKKMGLSTQPCLTPTLVSNDHVVFSISALQSKSNEITFSIQTFTRDPSRHRRQGLFDVCIRGIT